MSETNFRLPAQKDTILPKNWNIALELDFKRQYLRFYWTDFAEILHANKKKAYFSSPKFL